MSIANLNSQLTRIDAQGYPKDGSRALPPRLERLCTLLAKEEHKRWEIASMVRVSESTITRVRKRVPVDARVRFLREQYRAAAYDAAPLVDKRNRVVMAATLAERLHEQGEARNWRDTVAVTKQGTEITGFDWRRTDQVRQLLDYIAKEVGDRTAQPASSTTVNVGISMNDAVTRVQALLSRVNVEGVDAIPMGGVEGGPQDNAEMRGARSLTEYENIPPREATEYEKETHAGEPVEGEYEEVE